MLGLPSVLSLVLDSKYSRLSYLEARRSSSITSSRTSSRAEAISCTNLLVGSVYKRFRRIGFACFCILKVRYSSRINPNKYHTYGVFISASADLIPPSTASLNDLMNISSLVTSSGHSAVGVVKTGFGNSLKTCLLPPIFYFVNIGGKAMLIFTIGTRILVVQDLP